ncbi:T9SS type A sorting domain-containing protein [Tenacibaculum agarivorans]|uniref:T9SS type A sorting domain-containing protein n=1 Tax=Tenacibaculum agarivorans TaxID=1908389 RepID=UPI00094BA0FA|nr:T9SS type A sorting domain-containing protein [Tenacibaculum agarivorans]
MKKIVILLVIILAKNGNAQLTDIVTGLNKPGSIAIHGNTMYIGERDKVVKIDLTDPNPTPMDVLTGFDGGVHLLVHKNELFVAMYRAGKVVKLDLSNTNPVPVDVVDKVFGANGLAIKGNYLYIAESTGDKISRIDLREVNPVATDIITGVDFPNALLIKDNDLYFIQVDDNKISKIDLSETNPTPTDIITDLDTPSLGLLFIEGELYFSQYGGDKISKINSNAINPIVTDVITDLNGPSQLLYVNNELFIAVLLEGRIAKISNAVLSVEDIDSNQDQSIRLYPNPTTDFITITGLKSEQKGTLYDVLGKKMMSTTVQNSTLDVQDLQKGMYYLVLANGWSQRILKK